MDFIPLVERCKDGDVIITEGITSNNAYVVLSGKVNVVKTIKGREVTVATLKKGDVFGEMGLIGEAPRTASIVAVGKTTLGMIEKEIFTKLLNQIPGDFQCVIKAMVSRLSSTTEKLAHVGLQLELNYTKFPEKP